MAKSTGNLISFISGISDSNKAGVQSSLAFNRSTDFRTDPTKIVLNPMSQKDTGSLIEDLPMWMERAGECIFAYDKSGNLYKKESSTWSKLTTVANSQGNGLAYFGEDQNLYYSQDKTLGRILKPCSENTQSDGFLESEGGEATNTKSLDLEASSSQYASRADTNFLSITSDLSMEAYLKPESLPSTGNTMTMVSKWDENTDLRSYKFDIGTVSDFFGDGSDGALTISTNTTEAPIDSTASGTSGTQALTATNASFVAGQKIVIHQTRGTNAGVVQYTEIQSYIAGTITTTDALDITFITSGNDAAQIRVLKQYTDVTINTGITYTTKAWNGSVGGILGFYANGTVTIDGNVIATGKGFRGGAAGPVGTTNFAYQGEGTSGFGTQSQSSNGSGGGGGSRQDSTYPANNAGGGGGASNASGATSGYNINGHQTGGSSGTIIGVSNLTTILFGGGGGGGAADGDHAGTIGGDGGGIILLFGANITINNSTGEVVSNGSNAIDGPAGNQGSDASGGAGGSILLKSQTCNINTIRTVALKGSNTSGTVGVAGISANGIINIDYLTSVTGTSNPAYSSSQDSSLGTSDGYSLRLSISDDGVNVETYIQEITNNISLDEWARWQVSWQASISTALFYKNGVLLGTKTGSMISIDDNASRFAIGCDFDSSGNSQNFIDGLNDDIRVWNDIRTQSEFSSKNDVKLIGNEGNLVAYYELEDVYTDSQIAGNNDLTASGSPVFSTDVPFIGLTSRTDQDQSGENNSAVAGTYTLETSIDEVDTKRVFFVPDYDPQKSIVVKISDKGTGDWTLKVHDAKNREVATSTFVNSELTDGFFEFEFSSDWRPIIGATYHFHIISTVADGIVNVKTGETTLGDGTEMFAYFTTHYSILVEDQYHPMMHYQNMLVIGNERYIATLEGGDIYNPHKLTLPSGYRVRTIGRWREYVVFGMWRGTNITDYENGKLVIWDGVSETYNQIIDVPEGGINCMFGTGDTLYFFAGYTGELMVYVGGLTAQKVKRIPRMTNDKYIEFAPGSMSMWRTQLTFGTNLLTDSTDVHQGIYTFGTKNASYPYSLSFDYPLSLGDQTSTSVKIGTVFPSGQDLYIGWQNSNTFGIDKVSVTNDVYSSGTVELLISDFGKLSGETQPLVFKASFEQLKDGESIRTKFKKNRASSWQTLETEDTAGAIEVRTTIDERLREAEFAVDLLTTISTSPALIGVALETENLGEERDN